MKYYTIVSTSGPGAGDGQSICRYPFAEDACVLNVRLR